MTLTPTKQKSNAILLHHLWGQKTSKKAPTQCDCFLESRSLKNSELWQMSNEKEPLVGCLGYKRGWYYTVKWGVFISLRLMPPAFAGLEIAISMARSTTKSSSNNNTLSIASSMARSATKSNSNSSNNQQQQ